MKNKRAVLTVTFVCFTLRTDRVVGCHNSLSKYTARLDRRHFFIDRRQQNKISFFILSAIRVRINKTIALVAAADMLN